MTRARIILAAIVFFSVLTGWAPPVLAGAQDTGILASCEVARPRGIPILATAALSIDLTTNIAVATIQTRAYEHGWPVVVLRAMVAPDLGVSPMQYVCDVLNGPTAEGGATLAEQILAAVGLPGRTIAITKRSIFGCDVLPCADPGRRPDFMLVPGSADIGFPVTTALGDVIFFAERQ